MRFSARVRQGVLLAFVALLGVGGVMVIASTLPNAVKAAPGREPMPQQARPSVSETDDMVLTLPTPPRQNDGWQAPMGKDAEGLPATLLSATETLFAQGLPDPRGCEYRAITVQVGSVWRGDGGTVETHGWVLPAKDGDKRFAVCWNGLVYPVVAVKEPADLDADVRRIVEPQPERSDRPSSSLFRGLVGGATPESASVAAESPTLMKAVYLLRLGKTDLARALYEFWNVDKPPRTNNYDEIRRDPYLHVAEQWVWAAYDRAVCAHMRGADRLAASDSALLLSLQPALDGEAEKRGFKNYPSGSVRQSSGTYFSFLSNLPTLHRDSVRRLQERPRPPFDADHLKQLPQKQRIDELIARLDEVNARQDGQPGGVGLDAHPVCEALIREGNPAVDAIHDTLEKDERLTRSVSFPRDFKERRNLLTVKDAAWSCFARITGVTEFGRTQPSAMELRAWWTKNRDVTEADRWFAQLADEGKSVAVPNAAMSPQERDRLDTERRNKTLYDKRRWEEAARHILERSNVERHGNWVTIPPNRRNQLPPPFKGEALRRRQNLSVSELLRRRALQMSEPLEGRWGFDFQSGATFALILYEWDSKGQVTLPTLQTVMRRCLDFQSKQQRGQGYSDQFQLGGRIARLTVARLRLGDSVAAGEYKDYLKSVSPQYLGFETKESLYVLWQASENPAVRVLADSLFDEKSGPETPWSNLLSDPLSRSNFEGVQLLGSDLLRVAAFRNLVVRRLSDKTIAGTATQLPGQTYVNLKWRDGGSGGPGLRSPGPVVQVLRTCDRCALYLQGLGGVPPFDAFGSIAARDEQCHEIAAYLKQYGKVFGRSETYQEALYAFGSSFGDGLGPTFPSLDHPATEADVQSHRAIFRLRGIKTRVVTDLPAPLPLDAQWDKDPKPGIVTGAGNKEVSWSRGRIWQAEEEWDGTKWVRYYGYVGSHSIAKVPASEIEITDYRVQKQTAPPAAPVK